MCAFRYQLSRILPVSGLVSLFILYDLFQGYTFTSYNLAAHNPQHHFDQSLNRTHTSCQASSSHSPCLLRPLLSPAKREQKGRKKRSSALIVPPQPHRLCGRSRITLGKKPMIIPLSPYPCSLLRPTNEPCPRNQDTAICTDRRRRSKREGSGELTACLLA